MQKTEAFGILSLQLKQGKHNSALDTARTTLGVTQYQHSKLKVNKMIVKPVELSKEMSNYFTEEKEYVAVAHNRLEDGFYVMDDTKCEWILHFNDKTDSSVWEVVSE